MDEHRQSQAWWNAEDWQIYWAKIGLGYTGGSDTKRNTDDIKKLLFGLNSPQPIIGCIYYDSFPNEWIVFNEFWWL